MRPTFLHPILVLAVGVCCALSTRAIDPLPPEMESAPLEVRAEYWNKMGKDAQEQRTKVAQQRHDKRAAFQRSVAQQVAATSAERLASIQAETAPTTSSTPSKKSHSGGLIVALVFFVGIGCGTRKFAPQFADSIAAFRWRRPPSSRTRVRSRTKSLARVAELPAESDPPAAKTDQPWLAPGIQPSQEAVASSSLVEDSATENDEEPVDPAELGREFCSAAPSLTKVLEDVLFKIIENNDQDTRLCLLGNFYLHIDSLANKAQQAGLLPAFKISSTIGLLVRRMLDHPENTGEATLGTIISALEVLKKLSETGVRNDLAENPPVRMLVVDDDLLARRAMACALQTAFDKPDSADGGETALALATANPYDVIFLDINMPGMDGYTLCSRIHETKANRLTPVVFVSSENGPTARTKAISSGGSDLLTKPFVLLELTLKALTFALEDRLQRQHAASN